MKFIYVLGHSWGAYLGLVETRRHPENVYAYIGAGQMVDLVRQEQLSHDFVTTQAQATQDHAALQQLKDTGYPPYRDLAHGMEAKYRLLWRYGGMIQGETGPLPFALAMLRSNEYSLWDCVRFLRGMAFSLKSFADNEGARIWRLKAPDPAVGFQTPVFFITGEHDRVTPPALVEEYVRALRAPMKQSIVLPGAGHFAFFTDTRRFAAAVVEIHNRTFAPLDRATAADAVAMAR
ncbi:MAG: alpha/beta hydrolase [Pseudomonadota bacterium]